MLRCSTRSGRGGGILLSGFKPVPFSGTPLLFQQQKPKRSQAAIDALRRSAELNTGEQARQEAADPASFKQPKQKPRDPFEPDSNRKGFNTIDPEMMTTEFLGFMKKGAGEDESKPDGPLPCDSVGQDEKDSSSSSSTSAPSAESNVKKIQEAPTSGGAQDATSAAKGAPNWQDKKKLWKKLKEKQTDFLADQVEIPAVNELEYMRIEKELKTEDRFHWRIGQIGIDDEQLRND